MNPDNIYGFSTSNTNTPTFSSNSRSSAGLSRPRFYKVRKQLGSHNIKSTLLYESPGVGYNPFRPPGTSAGSDNDNQDNNNAFVFGLSRSDSRENLVADQMGKLHIGNDYKGRFHNRTFSLDAAMDLQHDMTKLNIHGGEKHEGGFGGNVGGFTGKAEVTNEKMSVHDSGGVGGTKEFVFGSGKMGGDSFVGDELPNRMKNLNLNNKNEADSKVDEKERFVFGSYQVGERENVLSNEMGRKLNIVSEMGDFSGKKSVGSLSSRMFVKDNRTRNLGDEKFQDLGKSGPREFSFQAAQEVNHEVGEKENILSNEMGRKLNIASETGDFSEKTSVGNLSSRMFVKDNRTRDFGDRKFQDLGKSVSREFSFQAAKEVNDESDIQVHVDQHKPAASGSEGASSSFLFSSIGVNSQPNEKTSEVPSMSTTGKMNEFSFTSTQASKGTPSVEFKTPHQKTNLFSGRSQNLEFNAKRDPVRDAKGKIRKGKLRQSTPVQLSPAHDFVYAEVAYQEKPEPADSYSPMDVSPYREETLTDLQCSRENSVASDDSQPTVSNDAPDEDLVAATQHMDINEGDVECRETKKEHPDRFDSYEGPEESGAETESFKSANEVIDFNINSSINSDETEVSSSLNIERQDSGGRMQFNFSSCSGDVGGSNFTFAASQGHVSSSKQHHRKKSWVKLGCQSFNSTADINVPNASSSLQFPPLLGTTQLSPPQQDDRGDQFSPPRLKIGQNSLVDRGQECNEVPNLTSSASIAAQEACEKWRLRGNQAYMNGHLSKAEDCYTQGINCVSKSETSRSCLRALMLCYSNRAAAYMSLGRMRDALGGCMMAAALDPHFLRVQVRAANCYLALGEIEDASRYFRKCLQSGSDICVDRKVAVEASDGLQKAQKVAECMQCAADFLQNKTPNNVVTALEVIDEALLISSYSEKLLEMKAEALFMLRKYEEVIQLCDQTMDSAAKNSPPIDADGESSKDFTFRLWRTCFIFRSHFNLGKLEEAIASLEKQDKLGNVEKSLESLVPLATTVRELLHHKVAGNEAFQAGRHAEAVEHYTAALSMTVESRPFAAICFCNRAAAYKALGHITDAIADCSLAIALDGNYLKAISRRATLYEMIRDYGQAATDLQRLITLLTKQVELASQSGLSDRSSNWASDLRQARMRLAAIEEEARKDIPLDMYLILDIEPSVSVADVKKAYRKAALRHHPDKAGQSLVRSDNGDDGLWREIAAEVYKDADRLFKMIGEAYAVLSDPVKRSRYDSEEETRNAQKKRNGNNTSRTHTDAQNYPFESSSSRRQWRYVWRSYGAASSTKRSEDSQSNKYS